MSGDDKINLHEHIEKLIKKEFRYDTWTNICNNRIGICKHTSTRYKTLMKTPSYKRLNDLINWCIKMNIADEVVLKYKPFVDDMLDGIVSRRKGEPGYNRKYYLQYKERTTKKADEQPYNYWELVRNFKEQQQQMHGRYHPFFTLCFNPALNKKARETINNE